MKLFTISKDGKLSPYKEFDFKESNYESDLEDLLESNPEYFFEYSKILIIGRQVTTNLNTFIDLLGVDKYGNSVVIELKRDKTPRETLSQLLEYASFIEMLDYTQLNQIFLAYSSEGIDLADYHKQYFSNEDSSNVSFNKHIKLMIIGQEISREVKQTSGYLRKNGIDIYSLEFKYFQTESGEKIISSDFVIGDEDFKREEVISSSLPKVDEKTFMQSLDENGKIIYNRLFEFAKKNKLVIIWGSKGFSLNYSVNNNNVALLFGYPPNSIMKQSIYTRFDSILRKVKDSQDIVESYKSGLISTGLFENFGDGNKLKWLINKSYNDNEINSLLNCISEVVSKIQDIANSE
ncbi:MAG TPA: endonuclease NucS [Spirochaetota bacterium]|nr:endonuclease NucS [Spirochaetota bacterium]